MNAIEQEYFKAHQASRRKIAEVFDLPDLQGTLKTVVDKYTETTHFLYELIQNADDAQAANVFFQLTPDGLYFRHDGKERFTVSNPDTIVKDKENGTLGHLNAITAVGFSTKDKKGTTNTIGKFGIGFKSVYHYTQTPHIF